MPLPESSEFPSATRRLAAFRGRRSRVPLHPAERGLLWLVGVHLCFLPWALGTMQAWSQIISLLLAAAEVAVALCPRMVLRPQGEGKVRAVPWGRLRRFPIFWIGAALLLLVVVQGLNSAWQFVQNPRFWWLVRRPDVPWLPAGVDAPFGRFNAWRDLLIGAAAWLAVCAVWIGFTRRRSLRIVLGILTANGVGLGLLEFHQRLSGDDQAPWPLSAFTGQKLSASFIYKNHAGAYFGLIAFAAIALATWSHDRGRRTLMKSTPTGVWTLAALLLAGSVLISMSKGAALILALFLLAFAGWFLVRRGRAGTAGATHPVVTALAVAGFAVLAAVTVCYGDLSPYYRRFNDLAAEGAGAESVRSRLLMHAADGDMLRANWVRGVGAGGFRYLFPAYLRHYPPIYQDGQLYWEHAHGDWWEVPIELGLAGDLLLLAGAAWWIRRFSRLRLGWQALSFPLVLGALQTVVHAGIDFPLQCPAILTTWCILLAVAGRYLELEEGSS
jgi:hypothetical protein